MASGSVPPSTEESNQQSAVSLEPETPKKPNIIKRAWLKLGITPPIVMIMLKGALAPIIALAAYQSDVWAHQYTTLGYLCAIMALISLPIQPRAKFIQSMGISLFLCCLGAAVSLLAIQCAVSARQTSSGRGATILGSSGSTQSLEYNAAASATAAVWLFGMIWTANLIRAYRPQLMLPTIQYSIFVIVSSTYSPQFPNMTAGMNFARRLLITFLTGFGISTGVSLFVFPMTSRKIVAAQMGGLTGLLKAILGAHGEYMHSITNENAGVGDAKERGAAEAKKLRALVEQVGQLFGKMKLELGFARKEIAYGKWTSEDLSEIFKYFRNIMLPCVGLCTFLDIMHSAREKQEATAATIDSGQTLDAIRRLETEEWDEVLSMSREPYVALKKTLAQGLDHICYTLEITKKPKVKGADVEEKGESPPKPGDTNFSDHVEAEVQKFHQHRETVIQRWCLRKGIELPTSFWEESEAVTLERVTTAVARKKENQHQLYLILYIEFLVYSIGKAVVNMAKYADSKVEDGTMSKMRVINPGWRRLRKLFLSMLKPSDTENILADQDCDSAQVWVGDSLKQRRDPEHLPPITGYQKFTHHLRSIPRLLSSPESAFAFRAAIATISIGIIGYLRQTWIFFLQQRGLWALIMVAISMGSHAGQGIFGFAARILGTIVAMCASMVIWYIGYKQPGAILPVFYIYLLFGFLFVVKFPNYVIVGMISMVTTVLIIGYELQEQKIGKAAAESNGQPFYEIYLLAPYRLAAVLVGLAAAFIWTYIPYPVTTHSTLRKDMGRTLYLLGNYYSCVHTTVNSRLRGGPGSVVKSKKSPMARLDKARLKVLSKCVLMISRLREHSHFTKFEPTFGGKFPKAKYDELIHSMSKIFHYLSLIAYSSDIFVQGDEEESEWLRDFRKFTSELTITSHEITSTLCLLSASIINGQPLPPYLKAPKPFGIGQKMESTDPEILSVKHVAEPCYAAFAVLEVASALLTEELARVVRNVQDLVGEVDFSFHVISSNSDQSSNSSTLWEEKEQTGKGKYE